MTCLSTHKHRASLSNANLLHREKQCSKGMASLVVFLSGCSTLHAECATQLDIRDITEPWFLFRVLKMAQARVI